MDDNPRQNVTFASNGNQAHGYLATPPSGRGPGMVVIQEWWGLTDHIVDVCDRLAGDGFVALAPDLFGGRTTHDSEEAAHWSQELPAEQAARDLSGAVDYLLARDETTGTRVGVVGFCMGGGFVLLLAAHAGDKVGAAVLFYGLTDADLSGVRAPVLGHIAERDQWVTPERARELARRVEDEAGVDVTIHVYPGTGHAFFNDEHKDAPYDPDAAALAWSRTLEFLRSNLA
jgi:carboxymethylenebutenolidase